MLRTCLQITATRLLLLILCMPASALAQLDLDSWDTLLKEAVDNGHVDYRQWADSPRFDALVQQIEITDVSGMTRGEKLVFYINAYNILAARGILDGSSPDSLLGRHFYFKRDKYSVAGDRISLHALEHERIRPLGEPRIHFAIVCASQSCPILQSHAYTLERLEQQLDAAARQFINDERRNRFDVEARRADLSSIFKWFEEDFIDAAGSLQAYVARYVDGESAALLREGAFSVKYLDYDWNLNGEL
ncbi:MAG: DUF547 domain-containing protein [Halioglobus sp.]|nr:DUF547 domain-containing protein [Halioglobus sp.]